MLSNFFFVTFCYYGICFISERLFVSGDLYLSMFYTTLSEIPGILIAIKFLDRTGRKGMMSICWFVFVFLSFLILLMPSNENASSFTKTLVVAFVFIARCSVTMVFLVLFVYFSEYYPTVIRSTALGFGSSLGRIAGMITTVVAEDLTVVVAMLIYCLCGFFSFLLTLMLPMDTTGLKMMDQVNRGDVEMSRFSRNSSASASWSDDKKVDNLIEELHGGIRGQLQQFKAHVQRLK